MKTPNERTTDGQAAAHVAVLMVVLLMAVALAVDFGNVLQRRRQMQNAADAGALAGAYDICFGDSNRTVAQTLYDARVAAVMDARANGADKAVATFPMNWTVNVTTTERANTFFLNIIGMDHVDVGAAARATCGVAKSGCGFWPIALGKDIWLDVQARGCGTEFVVIDSDKICGIDYDCDPDGDGVDDIFMGGSRGWLDLPWADEALFPTTCPENCGDSMVKCYIENDYPGLIELDPDACILSETGTMSAAFSAAGDEAGRTVRIPVFDGECDAAGALGGCGGSKAYNIVTIACVDVIEYDKKFEIYDLVANKWTRVEALLVSVSCNSDCSMGCAGTGGGPPGPGDGKGVSLTR